MVNEIKSLSAPASLAKNVSEDTVTAVKFSSGRPLAKSSSGRPVGNRSLVKGGAHGKKSSLLFRPL